MDLKYEAALTSVFWHRGGIDNRFFATVAEQTAYFESKCAGKFREVFNFPINDNVTTAIYYQAEEDEDITDLLRENYCVIRKTDDNGQNPVYRYFFASSAQDSGNQLRVTLELDDIQTNYFRCRDHIAPCLIDRCMPDRFVPVTGDETRVKFNNAPNSIFMNYEGVDLPKRLISRDRLKVSPTNRTDLKQWFQSYNYSWLLVFLKTSIREKSTAFANVPNFSICGVDMGFILLVAPVDSDYTTIAPETFQIDGNNITKEAIFEFINGDGSPESNLSAHVLNIKVTTCPPFDCWFGDGNTYEITNGHLNVKIPNAWDLQDVSVDGSADVVHVAALTAQYGIFASITNPKYAEIELPETTFLKSDIVGAAYNPQLNPKALSMTFKELKIVDYAGNSYSYDVQKINADSVRLYVTEALTSDITKGYARLENIGCYAEGSAENLTGLVYSNDTSIPFSVDQLSEFLANNKNYSLMQQAQRDYRSEQTRIANNAALASMAGNLVTGVAGMAAGGAGVGAAVGALGSAINTGIGIAQRNAETQAANEFSKQNETMTLDNMRSAPDALRNAQGNILFTMLFQHDPNIFAETYEALESDSRKMLDYMNMYGFKYGLIGKVSDFDNVRTRFNYIAANVDLIDYPLSDTEHERLKQALKAVRFWNSDTVSYDLENYERSLDNGE